MSHEAFMNTDPFPISASERDTSDTPDDLFGKLDSLIQKHHGRAPKIQHETVPKLTEPVESIATMRNIPVLKDVVEESELNERESSVLLEQTRRQLQVALYLRLRQHLDQELDAALADNLRLGAVAVDPAFTRVAQELRAVLPTIVRESVEQVLGHDSLEALLLLSQRQARTDS
jgi:hypothetical protein